MTKILPSPIWPVLAAAVIASTTLSTWSSATATSMLDLRQEVHGVFGAAIDFRVALLAAVALDLGDGHALHAEAVSASRTSSSLNGLMMAMTSFMEISVPWRLEQPWKKLQAGGASQLRTIGARYRLSDRKLSD